MASAPWSGDAARQVGAAPAAARRRARALRAASRAKIYIHKFSHFRQKQESVLVACSLERYARHTQTVNLYAPLTLRFGLTHTRL